MSSLPAAACAKEEKSWQLKASYVEVRLTRAPPGVAKTLIVFQIYNEQLRDLLIPESTPAAERATVSIREDNKGRIALTGVQQVAIETKEDLLRTLESGSAVRQADSTRTNAKSSRSHAIFTLNLVQKKSRRTSSLPIDKRFSPPTESIAGIGSDTITVDSKLHFVDLAGSEKLKNSESIGERAKDGISTNAGLASLAKVISQLSSRSLGAHVSYRDSRLTRLLQDSLGGNAITYMLACVNPVEFHLTETLNTIHYAQRARAIQSKPLIQHRMEDGDKQLVIDRLRSEIASLREQIRLSERSERKTNGTDRSGGRKQERENELQNQLLDIQENYSQLSQRHAKLMADAMQVNGHAPDQLSVLKVALKNSSMHKTKTPSKFHEAIEHVIMEYEKTIQSLESSLSNTRSALTTSESSLLEREAKIVYMEAVTQQLQARIQKSADREANSESYMKDVEARLDGIKGEEKHMVIIKDLRKELARIRESEASAEDYIASLEERLAEAEHDTDVMQREIRRLEQIVERQRCISAADSMPQDRESERRDMPGMKRDSAIAKYRLSGPTADMFHDRLVATTSATHPNEEVLQETAEREWKSFGPMEGDDESVVSERTLPDHDGERLGAGHAQPSRSNYSNVNGFDKGDTSAQTRVLADKLDTVTTELVDLKIDHEVTVNELSDISRKYQSALQTLAELREAVGGARQPNALAFLDGMDVPELSDAPQLSSRLLPSEFSSLGESPTLIEASDTTETMSSDRGAEHKHYAPGTPKEETLADSIRRLKRANAEKDINMAEIAENYSHLQDQHRDTLNYIEELKDELAKADGNPTNLRALRSGFENDTRRNRVEPAVLATLRTQVSDGRKQLSAIAGGTRGLSNGQIAAQTETATEQMLRTLNELESTLSKAETQRHSTDFFANNRHTIIGIEGLDSTKTIHDPVSQLQKEVELHKASADSRAAKLARMESNYSQLSKKHDADAAAHRNLVMNLEDQIDQQKSLAMFHQQGLRSLQDAHARDLASLKASVASGVVSSSLLDGTPDLRAAHEATQRLERRLQDLTASHERTLAQLEQSTLKEQRSTRLVAELEDQLAKSNAATDAASSSIRPSSSYQLLPSPAPTVPLPPIPGTTASPKPPQTPPAPASDPATLALIEEQEHRIRTIEKHLYAEKQLTATLEEALVELEGQANATKADAAAWKKRAREAEDEANGLRRERGTMRNSLQTVEEERDRRIRAEQARRQLEERMEALGKKGKNRKGGLNCF